VGARVTDVSEYKLSDRYLATSGPVFLSGVQALARLPLDQLRADRRAGLNTAAFISGYQGSPLGGYDKTLRSVLPLAPDLPVVHQGAINEELAATAVMGSQLSSTLASARYDGVVGFWYGKAPGFDRAADALRHAVFAGTSPLGGAVALIGDDPLAKSSTVPSSSAGIAADLHMPLLYPAGPGEALDLGRHAIAISRASGLWTALKIVADVADGTASVDLDPNRVVPVIPLVDGEPYQNVPSGALLAASTLPIEQAIYEVKYPLAQRYAAENRLNSITVDSPDAWIGIVASGITYNELREALTQLGLRTDADVASVGIRLIRMQMPLPFDPERMRSLTRGLREILVIEEKHPHIESLIKDALYGLADRPLVVGKTDERGDKLLPSWGALVSTTIAGVVRSRLEPTVGDRLAPPPAPKRELIPLSVARSPYFCSGCPHNRSTEPPPDSLVGAGIGCHTLALLMEQEQVGNIVGLTAMGNEGAQWIGMAPFVEEDHLFQNIGDGTYFHSGMLAVTAAVAAEVNITYKLLYNGTVAMTGGQDPGGQLDVGTLAQSLLRLGVTEVLITSDEPLRSRAHDVPKEVLVWHRDRLVEAQERLATIPGVTVLIHDQACAAEARRARKRGLVDAPDQLVVINQRVCEGCGDCGAVSNCLSVQPVDTPFGRKTTIDQTTCNLDYSCLDGDCPSFMTVHREPGRVGRLLTKFGLGTTNDRPTPTTDPAASAESTDAEPTEPAEPLVPVDDFAVRLTGVGGTGVVTVAQILGTAAMMGGYQVQGLDQIGMSQKAGPVVSDLRMNRTETLRSSRLTDGQADLLLVFDPLVGAADAGLSTLDEERTVVVGATNVAPTGEMIIHPETVAPTEAELAERLAQHSRPDHQYWADAHGITESVLGSAQTANLFVIGMAVQTGALPIDPAHIERAIELNGTAVQDNIAAFHLGRRQVDRPATTTDHTPTTGATPSVFATRVAALDVDADLADAIARFADELVEFQNRALAEDYLDHLRRVRTAETAAVRSSQRLTAAVAANLYKLLAYKDEYEVARLLFDTEALGEAEALAGPSGRVKFALHPPMFKALGLDHKISLGASSRPALRALAKAKVLRGTPLDPFGRAEVRRTERELPGEYLEAIDLVLANLTAARLDDAVALAELPDVVRGYEDLKMERVASFRAALAAGLGRTTQSPA
jgi:indolepyruvate ferredoxin oxidoreductase